MDEYTPTTKGIRDGYAWSGRDFLDEESREARRKEFDRWLADKEREKDSLIQLIKLIKADRAEAMRKIEEAVNVAHNSWVNLDSVPDIGGMWVNQEEILDALTGDESIEVPIWRDAWDDERKRADRAEARLARVTGDSMKDRLAAAIADQQACGYCSGECAACQEEAAAVLATIRAIEGATDEH